MPRKDVAVPPSRPDPIASSHLLRAPRKGSSQDYRRMVEAIQADDLDTARRAYGHLMERLSSAGAGTGGALAKIGASLRRGDLAAAQRTLDGLESKALRVLRGLRELTDLAAGRAEASGVTTRKPN
ncbi:hypothetical protein [Dongia sedimenti]|uniref:HPt domain-containing protein n=1 Tax=Dongia sedimenti TaxID=3064282 RepID=A0ABU0YRR9_9PROT|nr:hypothetical protein [Rhodospirillaceae bacterium R-7]